MNLNRICIVGYALNAKKMRRSGYYDGIQRQWYGGGLADIIHQASNQHVQGVKFLPWNSELSLDEQPDYDIIIHKLTEDILIDNSGRKIQDLKEYLIHHPNTIMIDPIESVQVVLSRLSTNIRLQQIGNIDIKSNPSFTIPNFIVMDGKLQSNDEIMKQLRDANMRLPVICKPIDACGTPSSHQLVVVVSIEGFGLVKYPCLVQQYWNHSAKLYKVYVIDREVMVFERPSLPDLFNEMKMKNVAFDSSANYPTLESFLGTDKLGLDMNSKYLSSLSSITSQKPVSMETFQNTAQLIARGFGLSLFGFDVIIPNDSENVYDATVTDRDSSRDTTNQVDQKDGNHTIKIGLPSIESKECLSEMKDTITLQKSSTLLMVIDVNYFPSFKEVSDFPHRLRAFLRKKSGLSKYEDQSVM